MFEHSKYNMHERTNNEQQSHIRNLPQRADRQLVLEVDFRHTEQASS